MARRIATVRGIALAPGVSKNGRLYTPENIGRAFERASTRLADPKARPLTMFTHHDGAGNPTHLVGRIAQLTKDRSSTVRFRSDIADTEHGRDIANLTATEDDQPAFLDGVSIRGRWIGPVRRVRMPDGSMVETADDLEILGLDYTDRPGVDDARIESSTPVGPDDPAEGELGGSLIFESVDRVLVEATSAPYGEVPYADPGYQKDRQKRYPLDTKRHAQAAWAYINQGDNTKPYTASQLKRVKGRIRKALKGFGVTTSEAAPSVPLAEDAAWETVTECVGDSGAGFSIQARNGPISVSISAYDGIEPAELEVIAQAAMGAACLALKAMDPDMDADIDVPGAPDADTDSSMEAAGQRPNDDQMETAPVPGDRLTEDQQRALAAAHLPPGTLVTPAVLAAALAQTAPPAPAAGARPITQEVPAVSEPQSPAVAEQAPATPAPAITLTADQFQQLLAGRAPVAESAPAAPAAPIVETEDQRVARLVAEGMAAQRGQLLDELREEVRQAGPVRKGLRTQTPGGRAVAEQTEGAEPTPEDERRARNEALLNWVSNGRYSLDD